MSEDYEDIQNEELEEQEIEEAELTEEEDGQGGGKFNRLLESDSRKYKLSGMFKDWFLDYSSYVILERAVPHIVDGLKPVQRRVLHAMYRMDDGNYTKVANIVGQAMQYHPHGDQSILGALVQLGQKNLTVDCQGNWGNILTGDSNAAPRYIEARLSKFAKEVVFDPDITNWMNSYDGRNKEPMELPVRFPLLLAQGTEGIAVGMASKILPHNFNELLDASVRILEGKPYELYPDFPTGGFADCSKYNQGRRGGTVKVRARIEKLDKNTVAITEIPYGKTTHMLIDSILKAKDKGKIKIKKIEDMTTDKVNIIIHLPNDVSPDKTIDALYAFTDCEANINPNACVIVENKPQFLSVHDILEYDTFHTRDLLEQQLRIRLAGLEDDWHWSSLERIFFQEGVYHLLEDKSFPSWEAQKEAILARMQEYRAQLRRDIVMEDIDRLVEKPVRKISRFDVKAIEEKIAGLEEQMAAVQADIDNITGYTIEWFKGLKKKYGKAFPRLTELTGFETIAATKVINNNAKLYANLAEGFVGIGLKRDDNGTYICDCSDLSEIIVIGKDGKYRITKVEDKAFFGKDLLYVGIFNRGDDRTIYNVIYREGKTSVYYAKRFAITSITRDKEYDITTGAAGSQIMWFTANHNGEAETVRIALRPKPKLKKTSLEYDFAQLAIKSKTARGNLVSKNSIARITLKSKGVSTIAGKDIWYDADIQKLNEDGRGQYLGQFEGDDKVLAIFKNGTFYTTSFDLVNKYQGDVLQIRKLDTGLTFTCLYYDGAAKTFYVKRFSFVESDNSPMLFISDAPKSYLVALSDDKHPQYKCTFGGKSAHKEPECIDAEEWIGKKGIAAKGKKCHDRETVKKVEFIEPLVKPEDSIPEAPTDLSAEPIEVILPEEDELALPTGEIVLPPAGEDIPELIIEEPTLF
ncbi:MAG: DNA gyrase/topoisomerase IV subunit A [Bacteroidales bacterium]|nr:DNA gyrase/topoisomerase IV subunit A [Bacteroidales bacterium]